MATKKCQKLETRYKSRFSFTVIQILVFTSSTKMVREEKDMFPNFKQFTRRYYYVIKNPHLDK